ncbi:hypothetical protein [Dictyobacter kobayashii]|uniref:Bacterial sugar transferase domain-containing protein n=1 Tax=Dictyobacter kobayashii TaxID=2014872 RepID=A0A402API6_9CHLR|nr:hypothetical protein [Dictyobacter kobayashii]GCE20964.1 hypothetical protein KDK_47640 [Dictyobacter kobayashii]
MDVEQHGPALSLASANEVVAVTPRDSQPARTPQRKKISPPMWRLALMVGDYLFLLLALASLLLLVPLFHPQLRITWNDPGTWQTKLIWVCIALISWSIAVTITQAQDLRRASNRFKSPLRAVLALLLMAICWLVLIYPFIADRLAIYTTALVLFLLVAIPLLGLWRIGLADIMNLPIFRPQAVIIGTDIISNALIAELQNARRPQVKFLGYINEVTPAGTQQQATHPGW